MSTKSRSNVPSPFFSLALLIIYPPFSTSRVKTQASINGSVPAMPIGSESSKTFTFKCGYKTYMKFRTLLLRVSKVSKNSEYAFFWRRASPVIPMCRTSLVTRHAWVSRSLWPKCMWSKVPPIQLCLYLNIWVIGVSREFSNRLRLAKSISTASTMA